MLVVGESTNTYIDGFSKEFLDGFMALLSRRCVSLALLVARPPRAPSLTACRPFPPPPSSYNTKRVRANQVYQEYIQDKNHVHMNSTKWITLTEFVKFLGKEGMARVDDTEEKGWFISWVDNSPAALARQARPPSSAAARLCW